MEEKDNPNKFSYPNADRPLPSSKPSEVQSEAAPHPFVHIQDALEKGNDFDGGTKRIKTFQSDIASAVKKDNVSMIKIALAEKKRQEKEGTFDTAVGASNPFKVIIVGGIILVALLIVGGAVFFFFRSAAPAKNIVSIERPAQSQILETEEVVPYDVTGKYLRDIEQFIQKQKTVKIELGNIQQIQFVKKSELGTQDLASVEFLNVLQTRAPDSILRSLNKEFLFGIYSLSPRDSFMILKIDPNSYDTVYAGMLDWEKYMEDDIGGLLILKTQPGFQQPVIPVITPTTTPSTTPSSIFKRINFVDRVINNKDTRVLLDENGKVSMLYTFLDQSTIVFASGEKILKEISVRLTTGRIVR